MLKDYVICSGCGSSDRANRRAETVTDAGREVCYECHHCGRKWYEVWKRKIVMEYIGEREDKP
jgi:uncharacterized Zn finger protein